MPRFFADYNGGEIITLSPEDSKHVAKALRMKTGEKLTVCDGLGTDYECEVDNISPDSVSVKVILQKPSETEADVDITIYQALPKSDKMDGIIQRAVELGAKKIVPILTERCVSRPDAKACDTKVRRWNKIALEAAMQCGRGMIPQVEAVQSFRQAIGSMTADTVIMFYEGGGKPIREMDIKKGQSVAVIIGPEGGFERSEVDFALASGAVIGSLGPRILRTQTASLAATAAIMFMTENM
ncbi:MAG: 16S rRNA (uracil(1498)-N(3))-methyltransferase [Clostridia bacterium]|nr:16S rRNA (uracil(1498)-N(3))-methyltransferase [Clostridia bacterium]